MLNLYTDTMERLEKNVVEYIQQKQIQFAQDCLKEIKLLVSEEPNKEVCLDDGTIARDRIYAVICESYEASTEEHFITKLKLEKNNSLSLTTDEGWIADESEVVYFDSVWPEMLKLLYQYIKTNRIS